MFGKTPLSLLGLSVGSVLTVIGVIAYALDRPTLNLIGFFYGIPLILGGLALKASELKPVPYRQAPSPEIIALRQQQGTQTQKQLIKDVTRYCYGQKAHLDRALMKLELTASNQDLPILEFIREEAIAGNYALILEFDSSDLPLATWQKQREKIEKYFGPGLRVDLTQLEGDRLAVSFIAI